MASNGDKWLAFHDGSAAANTETPRPQIVPSTNGSSIINTTAVWNDEILRQREHVPIVKDCLNRCERCDRGEALAVVNGAPLGAPSFEALLLDLDALAAEDTKTDL